MRARPLALVIGSGLTVVACEDSAPPHPAFEILLDNLIISKGFIEFGPNRFQIERVIAVRSRPLSPKGCGRLRP